MDFEIFENMDATELRKYIRFLLWHYRVVDAFWYLYVTEKFDESTADGLNERVWGKVTAMAAKDLVKRFDIQQTGLEGFVSASGISPGAFWLDMKLNKIPTKLLLPSLPARPSWRERKGA